MALPAGDYDCRFVRTSVSNDMGSKEPLIWLHAMGKSTEKPKKSKSLVPFDHFKVKTNRKERRAAEKKKR